MLVAWVCACVRTCVRVRVRVCMCMLLTCMSLSASVALVSRGDACYACACARVYVCMIITSPYLLRHLLACERVCVCFLPAWVCRPPRRWSVEWCAPAAEVPPRSCKEPCAKNPIQEKRQPNQEKRQINQEKAKPEVRKKEKKEKQLWGKKERKTITFAPCLARRSDAIVYVYCACFLLRACARAVCACLYCGQCILKLSTCSLLGGALSGPKVHLRGGLHRAQTHSDQRVKDMHMCMLRSKAHSYIGIVLPPLVLV